MEIKIKFGNNEMEFSDIDFFKKLNGNQNSYQNPFETMFPKPVLDFYSKLYENIPQSTASYYKRLNKAFEKYLDDNKPGIGKIPDSPDVFPANGHDIFNYVARYGKGNFHCQAILKLNGKIDFDKLSKAVRLSVDKEPVLGCRFVEGNPPYWKRLENIDKATFCTFENVNSINEATYRFIESPLDMDHDPMIKVKLMRLNSCDVIGIKANHACLDGTGIKEYVQLLSDIYSKINHKNDIFNPIPGTRGRIDQDKLFESLGITDPDALWIPGSDITIPTWAFPWKQDLYGVNRFVICRIPSDQLDEMSCYAKSRGATINDLILTAYYRAMLRMGQPVYGVPMGVTVTVDLRRYLTNKKTEAIRNFSGSVNTWLSMVENEAFSDTLSRVVYMMKDIKNGYPGLQSAIGLERLEKISFKDTLSYYQATSKARRNMSKSSAFIGNRCVPTLSNLGIISKPLVKFGETAVTDYFIIPPVVSAPGLLLEVSTYNGIMTMAVGFIENSVLRDDVYKLLNSIRYELLEGRR